MNLISDSETVPKILPQHIRTSPYLIPWETNAFLCQLLEVKMRELFPCVPYPMVKPRVSCFTVLNLMCNMWTVNESFAGSLHGGFLGAFLGLLVSFLRAS